MSSDSSSDHEETEFNNSSENEETELNSSSIAHGIVTTDAVPIPPSPTTSIEPLSVQARNESNEAGIILRSQAIL